MIGREPRESLVLGKPAVGRATDGSVRTPATAGEDRHAAPVELLVAFVILGPFLLGKLGLGFDVDPPSGQPGSQACVLAVTPDRQRQLVIRYHDRGLHLLIIDEDLAHTGWG